MLVGSLRQMRSWSSSWQIPSTAAITKARLRTYQPDMLVMADRNFYSFESWTTCLETAADLLWRVNSNVELPVLKALNDGSYLSMVINPTLRGKCRDRLITAARAGHTLDPSDGVIVRVVEYDIPDREGNGIGELICLITSILDPQDIPAIELVADCHERWEFEGLIDEVKTHQRGSARVLRSQSPEMVKQEIWALLLTHYGIRRLMCRAADEADVDPDRLSFIRSLRVIRRQVTAQANFPLNTSKKHTRKPSLKSWNDHSRKGGIAQNHASSNEHATTYAWPKGHTTELSFIKDRPPSTYAG